MALQIKKTNNLFNTIDEEQEKRKKQQAEETAKNTAAAEAAKAAELEKRKKLLSYLQDPNAPTGLKATDYLDMLSATGKMDTESKAVYDTERLSKGEDPALNYTAKVAARLAAQKQEELEGYKKSEEYKKTAPKIQTSGTGDFAADAGAFIGSILSNLFQTGEWKGDAKAGQLRAEEDYLQTVADKAKNESVILKDATDFEKWPEEDKKDLLRYLDYTGRGTATGKLPALLSGATAAKDRLDKKYGRETVRNILESMSWKLGAEDEVATTKAGQENASPLESLLSVPLGIVGGAAAASDYLGSILKDVTGVSSGRFSGIDPNTPGAMPMIYAEAVRQKETENVKDWAQATAQIHGADEKTQEALGAVASTVYTAGMGALDNLTRVVATGGVGTLALAATGSFSSAVRQATLNGASAQQAAAFGFVSAASEVLTEKLPLDNLLDNLAKAGSGAGILSILAESAKQAGIELTTEELNLVAGIAAEALILRENSDYRKGIAEMVAQGTPYNEAVKAANDNLIRQAGQTALQSGLSGFMTSAGTSVVTQQGSENRFTEAAQRYESDKQSAYDRVQDLLSLVKEKSTQTQDGTVSQQAAQTARLDVNELVDEMIAKNTGAPADPVGAAVESFATTGTVSNKQATDILNSVKAVQQLVQETGVKLDGLTMSQRRNAVKDAVVQIAQQNAVATKEPGSTLAAGERSTTDWILDAVYGRSKQNETTEKANVPNVYDEYILHNQDGTPFEAVGAASLNNTGRTNYQDLLTNENTQRDRVDDVRPVEVPKTDTTGKNVSNFAGNAYGSYLTTDSFTSTIEKLVLQGDLSHDTLTNEKSLENAAQEIALDGVEKSISNIRADAEKGIARPESVAKGTLLYRYLLEIMDVQADPTARSQVEDLAADVFTSLSQIATNSGRTTQLFSLFRRMSPSGQLKAIENDVLGYVKRMKSLNQLPQDYVLPSLSEENSLFQAFTEASEAERSATTDKERRTARQRMADAEDEIYKFIASQIPATQKDRWDAWRHLSMMGNARTQIRNFLSTAAFMPYRAAKQAIGSVIEKSIPQEQRTKAVIGFSKADRALLSWAKQDLDNPDVQRAIRYSARLGDNAAGSFIEDHRTIYKNKTLEDVRKFVRKVPQEADLIFKKAEYSKALAGFLKARGYTETDLLSAKVPDDVLNEGRQYAIDEAMIATFNDINAVSDAAVALRYTGKNKALRTASTLLEGAAPYRRTTANLAVRGMEYSPAGLFNGLRDIAKNVRSGEVTAAQAIDKISAGLTGSAAVVLGFALASGLLGLRIRGNQVPDEEKEAGSQEYSLEFSIDGKTYSYRIDWLGPAALPLFIGANIHDALKKNGEDPDTSLFAKAVTAGWATVEPILDISVLSAIGDTLLDAKYAPDDLEVPYVLANLATSYFTQGIPQLARQLVQAIPENRQETQVDASDPVTRAAQRMAGNIPVVGQLLKTDALDKEGNPQPQGSLPRRLFDSFINPGKLSEVDTSEETRNAMQTKKTISGFTKAFDSLTESFRAGSVDQKAVSNLDAAFGNYQKLSKELRTKIREETGGRLKYFLTAKEHGITTETFVDLYETFYNIDNGDANASAKASQWSYTLEKEQEKGTITASQKNALKEEMKFWQMMPAETSRFDSLTASGLSADKSSFVTELLDSIIPPSGNDKATQQQKIQAITSADGKLTDKEQQQVLKEVLSESAYGKYLEILALGYSNDDYSDSYRIYSAEKDIGGKGTKARTIEAFRKEFGISEAAATALYEIYVPK